MLAPTCTLKARLGESKLQGDLILAPPSILRSEWMTHLGDFKTAFASGWMQGSASENGGSAHGNSYDHGFVISDHADWNDLNQTILETEAKQVYVLHRGSGALVRHLRKSGISAYPISELLPVTPFANESTLPLFPNLPGLYS